MSYYVNI